MVLYSAVPFAAGPQLRAVKIACHDLVLLSTARYRDSPAAISRDSAGILSRDSAGPLFSAGIISWQSTALMRDHDYCLVLQIF